MRCMFGRYKSPFKRASQGMCMDPIKGIVRTLVVNKMFYHIPVHTSFECLRERDALSHSVFHCLLSYSDTLMNSLSLFAVLFGYPNDVQYHHWDVPFEQQDSYLNNFGIRQFFSSFNFKVFLIFQAF
jgi:hypothetical protein